MKLSGAHFGSNKLERYFQIVPALSYLVVKQDNLLLSVGISAEYRFKKFEDTDLIKDHTMEFAVSAFRIRNLLMSRLSAVTISAFPSSIPLVMLLLTLTVRSNTARLPPAAVI